MTRCPTCGLPASIGTGRVVPVDKRDHRRGWMLLDGDGGALMIGSHGCVAPTKAEAIVEGRERHARGDL